MRLIRVKAAAVRINLCCANCGAVRPEIDMCADLDGRPFVDYFCPDCVVTDQSGALLRIN